MTKFERALEISAEQAKQATRNDAKLLAYANTETQWWETKTALKMSTLEKEFAAACKEHGTSPRMTINEVRTMLSVEFGRATTLAALRSDISTHIGSAPDRATTLAARQTFSLDMSRVEAIKKETEEVAALLAGVMNEGQ